MEVGRANTDPDPPNSSGPSITQGVGNDTSVAPSEGNPVIGLWAYFVATPALGPTSTRVDVCMEVWE